MKIKNILLWVNKKIKNDILPTKCHLTICVKYFLSTSENKCGGRAVLIIGGTQNNF